MKRFFFKPPTEPILWSYKLPIGPVTHIEAKLAASSSEKCSVEIFAFDDYGEELAYCRGMVRPRHLRVRILWLGRSKERHVHQRVQGFRLKDEIHGSGKGLTIAEATLIMVAVISRRLGALTVELQALDNGSGKLVRLYSDLGFKELMPRNAKEMPWLETPIEHLTRRCPDDWLALVPSQREFDAVAWMQGELALRRLKENPHTGTQRWKWHVASPPIERIDIVMTANDPQKCGIEIWFCSYLEHELLYCRGVVRMQQRRLRLLWIGRTNSKAIEAKWKGVPCINGLTMAQVSLGLLCTLAKRLFYVTMVEVQTLDNGSGKLVAYFQSQSFRVAADGSAYDAPRMEAAIDDVALRCPTAWLAHLDQENFDGVSWFKSETASRTTYAWAPGGTVEKDSSTASSEFGIRASPGDVRGGGREHSIVSRQRLPGVNSTTERRPSIKVSSNKGGSNASADHGSIWAGSANVASTRIPSSKVECLGNLGMSNSLPGLNRASTREQVVDQDRSFDPMASTPSCTASQRSPKTESKERPKVVAASTPSWTSSQRSPKTEHKERQKTDVTNLNAAHVDKEIVMTCTLPAHESNKREHRRRSASEVEQPPPAAMTVSASLPSLVPKNNLSSTTTREPLEAAAPESTPAFLSKRWSKGSKVEINQTSKDDASPVAGERCSTATPRLEREKPLRPPRNAAKQDFSKYASKPADPLAILRSLGERLRAEREAF